MMKPEAALLRFVTQPTNTFAAETMPAVEVEVLDTKGDRSEVEQPIQLVAQINDGPIELVLREQTVDGLARFEDVVLTRTSMTYSMVASASGLDPIQSRRFTISNPPADRIEFLREPPMVVGAGRTWPSIIVEVLDTRGDRIEIGNVPLQLRSIPEGVLEGVLEVETSRGIGEFAFVRANTQGRLRVLVAGPQVSPAVSRDVEVVP